MFTRSPQIAILAGAALSSAALAGPLNPPAGPVTSSYKTLTEVEPRIALSAANTPGDSVSTFNILAPGSYYLTGNITGTSGKKGIAIYANNVTLDLNGFALMGGGVGDDAIYTGLTANVVVRNGIIRDWVKEGIDAYNSTGCRIENMHVENCVAGYGIITGSAASITGCIVRGSAAGFVPTIGSTVRDCSAVANGYGFMVGSGITLSGCAAQDSTVGPGFQTSLGCSLHNCTSMSNHGANGFGYELGSGTTVTSCSATANDLDGFHIPTGGTNVIISGCNAFNNHGNGIKSENGVGFTITGNNCSRNYLNGIQVTGGSSVTHNTCEDNGTVAGNSTSGIYVTFSYNRLDGNTCLGSSYGIAVASGMSNNLVIRNTVTLCTTPYQLPAGVAYGTINFLPSGAFSDTNSFANIKY